MSPGAKYILMAVILLSISTVHAISSEPTIRFVKIKDTMHIYIKNPSNLNVTIYIYSRLDNTLNTTFTTTDTTKKFAFSTPGAWTANVTVDGAVRDVEKFSIGTIFNTGFKNALKDMFKGDLTIVGVVIMIGVGVWAASIGRYAGLPVVLGALSILTALNYFPAWLLWVLIFVVAIILAKALAEITRTD